MTDFSLYMEDLAKKPSASGAWLRGPKITFDNLNHGTGPIEHISATEAMEAGGGPGPKPEYRGWNPKPALNITQKTHGEPVITFGKFKGKPMKWVRDNEPNYWEWALENVGFFAAQVEKANL